MPQRVPSPSLHAQESHPRLRGASMHFSRFPSLGGPCDGCFHPDSPFYSQNPRVTLRDEAFRNKTRTERRGKVGGAELHFRTPLGEAAALRLGEHPQVRSGGTETERPQHPHRWVSKTRGPSATAWSPPPGPPCRPVQAGGPCPSRSPAPSTRQWEWVQGPQGPPGCGSPGSGTETHGVGGLLPTLY